MKASNFSELGYLKPVVLSALNNLESMYNYRRDFLPDTWLPTAGKEISFTPLLVAGAFQSGISASTEIRVARRRGEDKSTGRIDLALFNKRRNIADAIEVKFSTKMLQKNAEKSFVSAKGSILSAMNKAKDQLESVLLPSNFGKVALVVHRFGFRTVTNNDGDFSVSELGDKARQIAKRFYKECSASNMLVAHQLLGEGHEVHSGSPINQGKIYCLGVMVVAERVAY